jgi:predicted nucleic acid-binding protein
MGTEYLLDTNTVIDFSVQKLPDRANEKLSFIIDTSPKISIINKIELLSFSNVPGQIIFFTDNAFVISLDENIVQKTIELRRKYKIKLPDAIIAATALIFDLTLITHNISDFKKINGLKLVDSYLIA